MLMGSIKSQAQNKVCYSPNQVKALNSFRTDCEKCAVDLVDTRIALDECSINGTSPNYLFPIATGVGGILLGIIIGGIIGANSH